MPLKDLIRKGRPPSPVGGHNRRRHHSHEPQIVNESTWYYETAVGLLLVHEVRTDRGAYLYTHQCVIPWRMVQASLKRHELIKPGS